MNKFLTFTIGAAVGSLVTAVFVKRYYRQQANEEIESVVQRFKELEDRFNKDHKNELKEEILGPKGEDNSEQLNEYNNIAKDYQKESLPPLTEEDTTPIVGPYVISPEEFDENGYDTCSLTYYKDDILLNDNDGTVIPDPEGFFGDDWKDHFGDYEDDAVHFRNDEEGVDYEILKSDKTFTEVYRDEENEED